MATETENEPAITVDSVIEPVDEGHTGIDGECEYSGPGHDAQLPGEENDHAIKCGESCFISGGSPHTDLHVDVDKSAQGCSGEKSQRRRGLKGRRLRAPSFQRRKFRPEPGTPSDSDSWDTKERRRQNVTTSDWQSMKGKKAKLDVSTSRKVEGDAPIPEADSPSPERLL